MHHTFKDTSGKTLYITVPEYSTIEFGSTDRQCLELVQNKSNLTKEQLKQMLKVAGVQVGSIVQELLDDIELDELIEEDKL